MNSLNNNDFEPKLIALEKNTIENNNKGTTNMFKILKIEDLEIRHSNFLQWLFDLKNNHNLASIFINYFFKEFDENCLDLINLNDCKDDIVEVSRETDNIDLIVKFNSAKLVVIIENKIYASESPNQLSKYYSTIENRDDLKDFTKKYIYLTLGGDEPLLAEDKKHWKPMSYVTIKRIVAEILKHNSNILNDKEKMILNDYLEILKEKTEDNMNKVENYHNLYKKHKPLLLDMIKYIPQINERAQIEKDYINSNSRFKLNTKNANTYIWFSVKEIDSSLEKYNLPDRFIELEFSNDPYDKLSIGFTMNKYNNIYKNFVKDFKENFKLKLTTEGNGDFVHFYTKTLLTLKNMGTDYKTEKEFQEGMITVIKDYFENENSEYFKIIDFIKNYNFKNMDN